MNFPQFKSILILETVFRSSVEKTWMSKVSGRMTPPSVRLENRGERPRYAFTGLG